MHGKETTCGCAGVFSAHAAIELYAEAFASAEALDKLEGFASLFGAEFYGLPPNGDQIALARRDWDVPFEYPFGDTVVRPFRAGEKVCWSVLD